MKARPASMKVHYPIAAFQVSLVFARAADPSVQTVRRRAQLSAGFAARNKVRSREAAGRPGAAKRTKTQICDIAAPGVKLTGVIIFIFALGLLITAAGYASLRFTTLDPQMPIPRAWWVDLATALGAGLCLLMTGLPLPAEGKPFFAFLSVTLALAPAMVPPFRLSKEKEPSWLRRQVRSFAAKGHNAKLKNLLGSCWAERPRSSSQ
ncbi:MAG: hypothetical protein QHC67_18250 [Sphingobium sp.]|uniref:hypothetical protein n=1 Tax=Sphingobium sp. TaxID=1912891 RepID=UPI0029A97019|nr:hypothetical protein [Sphingobium sp.]MDX3911718.1 hypothetical protein [Sphingobium sp.]